MSIVTTGDLAVRSFKCCVVFDASNGRIHHIHDVVTIEGAEEMPDDAVAREAMQLAAQRGLDTGSLETVHIDPEALATEAEYRVDPQTRSLVALRRDSPPAR
ncbi:hypothetical protein ABZ767_31090 [Streptomyces pseudogriseolus]|uniref:hypothetical protein n=1 Tax=Streptomyces pseudogriseolus TaxID=36817 RepID=UPI00348C79E9